MPKYIEKENNYKSRICKEGPLHQLALFLKYIKRMAKFRYSEGNLATYMVVLTNATKQYQAKSNCTVTCL